jgi:hypothetical protein
MGICFSTPEQKALLADDKKRTLQLLALKTAKLKGLRDRFGKNMSFLMLIEDSPNAIEEQRQKFIEKSEKSKTPLVCSSSTKGAKGGNGVKGGNGAKVVPRCQCREVSEAQFKCPVYHLTIFDETCEISSNIQKLRETL